jgi:hypothetical protein
VGLKKKFREVRTFLMTKRRGIDFRSPKRPIVMKYVGAVDSSAPSFTE